MSITITVTDSRGGDPGVLELPPALPVLALPPLDQVQNLGKGECPIGLPPGEAKTQPW